MLNTTHQVVTKDYSENLVDGIMICGINFGYSSKDEIQEKSGIPSVLEQPSFFSDMSVNKTRFRDRVLIWLSSWGLALSTTAGQEGAFERSFFQTNWLDTQTRSVTSNGVIKVDTLVEESDSFLKLVEARKPSVIIFIGAQMIEALNDVRIRDRVVSILGERSGNAKVYRVESPSYTGVRFKMLTQRFGETQIISLPHTQTRGVSDEYISLLKPRIHVICKLLDKRLAATQVGREN